MLSFVLLLVFLLQDCLHAGVIKTRQELDDSLLRVDLLQARLVQLLEAVE